MRKTVGGMFFVKSAIVSAAAVFAVIGCFQLFPDQNKTAASASGPSASFTAAPMENNCTGCHTGSPVNSGGGNVTITGLPANYLPGQQIPLTVTVNQADGVIFGFQLTAVDRLGRRAGSYMLPAISPQPLQIISGLVGGNERRYIEHTENGTVPTQFGTKSWNFTWTAPAERIGKLSFYAAGNAANSDSTSSGDQIYTTAKATLSGTAIANFDSDTRSDISVYRPSTGVWYAQTSGELGFQVVQYGESGDKPVPGDYDGDGKTDHAVFRASNRTLYIRNSGAGFRDLQFGESTDIFVPGDYDGDLKTDIAVWRPSTGIWYVLGSTGVFSFRQFGVSGDTPVQADYDGDGKTDIAVFRQSTGTWFMLTSGNNGFASTNFGVSGDVPVQGDYDGDGKSDIAVFRPSNGVWYSIDATRGFYTQPFGIATDKPAAADYDGDGKTDIAVFRDGVFYISGSEGPTYSVVQFGQTGDIAVASAYLAP